MWLPRMTELWRHGYFNPARSNNGRSLKDRVNKSDDRYNGLCVLTLKMHWLMKSQQPLAVVWAIKTRKKIGCDSFWSWSDSVMDRVCAADKKWYFYRYNCYLLQVWEPLNHWQSQQQIERIEDRQHKKGWLPSRPFSMGIVNIWRIFRNRVLGREIIGLLEQGYKLRHISYRRGTLQAKLKWRAFHTR